MNVSSEIVESGWKCGACGADAFGWPTNYCAMCGRRVAKESQNPPRLIQIRICTDYRVCDAFHTLVHGKPIHEPIA